MGDYINANEMETEYEPMETEDHGILKKVAIAGGAIGLGIVGWKIIPKIRRKIGDRRAAKALSKEVKDTEE